MSQHTPGPWHLGDSTDEYAEAITVTDRYRRRLATCNPIAGEEEGIPERLATHEEMLPVAAANARLIAAAPALLEALEKIAQAPQHHGAYSAAELLAKCCDEAKRAIAQARGEESRG